MNIIVKLCRGTSITVLLFLFFGFFSSVNADWSQDVFTDQATENAQTDLPIFQVLGTGLSGSLIKASYAIVGNGSFAGCLSILEYNNQQDFLISTSSVSFDSIGNRVVSSLGTGQRIECDYNNSFNSSKFYVINLTGSNIPTGYYILGNSLGNGYKYPRNIQGSLGSAYYSLSGTILPPTGQFGVTNTRFLSGVVSGTASSTVMDISYFMDTSDFVQNNRPDTLQLTVTNLQSSQVIEKKKLILPLSTGNHTQQLTVKPVDYLGIYATSTYLPDDKYTARFNFWNFSFSSFVLPTSLIINFTITNGIISSSTIVSLENGLFPQINKFSYQICSLTSLSGCIVNAVGYLFYPSEQSIDAFTGIYSKLSTKFPFAYMTDFRDSITNIYSSPTNQSLGLTVPFGTFGNITLISATMISDVPFTSTIRTILGSLIWLMLAFQIWRRSQTIFNHTSI